MEDGDRELAGGGRHMSPSLGLMREPLPGSGRARDPHGGSTRVKESGERLGPRQVAARVHGDQREERNVAAIARRALGGDLLGLRNRQPIDRLLCAARAARALGLWRGILLGAAAHDEAVGAGDLAVKDRLRRHEGRHQCGCQK